MHLFQAEHTDTIGPPCIPVTHKRRKGSKSITLRVHDDGEVVVSRPFWVNLKQAQSFVADHHDWIQGKLKKIELADPDLVIHDRAHYELHKEAARQVVSEKLAHWNKHYNFAYTKVVITRPRGRWGSCSSRGTLCFNYKIIFLPEDLQDYLIVHELCHLKQMNHSKKFWDLVEQTIPDVAVVKRRLGQLIG